LLAGVVFGEHSSEHGVSRGEVRFAHPAPHRLVESVLCHPDRPAMIRGVRNRSDLRHEYQLAAMNEALGITTLLLPAKPGLAGMSSTVLRGLGI
jgi:phosphopantetheine adenylyltransferase